MKTETATEMIERMERETGQRIDSNNGDNNAVAGLMGAIRRVMGDAGVMPKTPWHTERDDVAVGMYIKATSTPEYKQREAEKNAAMRAMMASMGTEMPGEDEQS